MSMEEEHVVTIEEKQSVEEKRDGSNEGERGESKGGATEAAMGSRDPGRASSC
jgi:hypothetical protein